MKRHFFVNQMNSESHKQNPMMASDGIYTITPAIGLSSAKGKINDGFIDSNNHYHKAGPPDYGTVYIYQQQKPIKTDYKSDFRHDHMFHKSGDDSDTGSNITDNDEDSDIISEYIGHYGLWQFFWTFLLCLFQIPSTFHIFALVFQAANREFWCARPAHLLSVPLDVWQNLTQSTGQCSIVDAPYAQLSESNFSSYFEGLFTSTNGSSPASSLAQISCPNGFEYDSRIFGNTLIAEFGLVCDRAHVMSIVEMCFLAGAALGSVGSGWISDQFGRRHTLMCFAAIQAVIGFIIGFVNTLWLFMGLRVIIGFASMSVTVVSFVLVVELVSGKYRTVIGILNILPVAISYILAAGIAYFAQDWRTMQFVITIPGALLLSMWYWLPESPRWLLAKGRTEELKSIIDRAAETNGFRLPLGYEKTLTSPEAVDCKEIVSVLDLFRMKFLRTTLVMLTVWFGIVLIYFGITLHLSNLGGDIYLNTILAGTVESIAICLSILVVLKLGLRVNLFLYMVVAGISCIVMNFVPDGNLWAIIGLAMIVKCAVGACNAIIPTFTAFQYPTTMRNLGVGAGNFAAGIALIIVPYLWLLEHVDQYLPITVMGVFSIIGGLSLIVLKDKLSKKYRRRGSGSMSGNSGTGTSTDDESRHIDKDFPRDNSSNGGLSNIGFARNESIFL
ncbi:organic cation transporter protein [Uranotaenia lowii]|uniref:organic cation transporter protein n=1 Tax=Uranotaenia lowii TaxID=190385 RepID=UPI0024789AE1|nr:organic cation transporter protein [Uranotaenia lowii]